MRKSTGAYRTHITTAHNIQRAKIHIDNDFLTRNCVILSLFHSLPLPVVPQVPGSGHLQVLSARAAHLLHSGLLEDHAVGAALPAVPSRCRTLGLVPGLCDGVSTDLRLWWEMVGKSY